MTNRYMDPANDRRVYDDDRPVADLLQPYLAHEEPTKPGQTANWPIGAISCLTCDGLGWLDHPSDEHRGLLCEFCGGDGYVTPGEHGGRVVAVIDERLEVTASLKAVL